MKYIVLALLLVGCAESPEAVNHAAGWTKAEQCQVWNKWGQGDGTYGNC